MNLPPPYHSTTPAMKPIAIAVISIVVAVGVVLGVAVYLVIQEENRISFSYQVVLELNGTGVARVSVPIPVDARLLSGLTIVPTSSTFARNESGAEPALDVTFAAPTWINGTWRGTGSLSVDFVNLTRTDAYQSPCEICSTEIALTVLSGDIFSVDVDLSARWSGSCQYPQWVFEGSILPGVHPYTGQWATAVC